MIKQLRRHWLILVLSVSLMFSVSCVGIISCGSSGAPQASDKDFAGTWKSEPNPQGTVTQLSIGHEEDTCLAGQVYAHGFNTQAKYAWSRMVFSGNVQKIGLANGAAVLWREGIGGIQIKINTFNLELKRSGYKLNFELSYKIGAIAHHDKVELTKRGDIL